MIIIILGGGGGDMQTMHRRWIRQKNQLLLLVRKYRVHGELVVGAAVAATVLLSFDSRKGGNEQRSIQSIYLSCPVSSGSRLSLSGLTIEQQCRP
jgi:hypothetical protein